MKYALKHAALAALLAAGFALPATSFATTATYDIDVTVADAPNTPGFAGWNFGGLTLPTTYHGTFTYDDTSPNPFGPFNLVIGGVPLEPTFTPSGTGNSFDPNTLVLNYLLLISGQSAVIFGNPNGISDPLYPANYAVAIQNTTDTPIDPYYGYTQNWVGTYSITKDTSIPEPATLALFAAGLAGFGVRRNRRA